MLLSAISSDDKRVFKFSVPKLGSCDDWSTPSLLLMLDKTDDPLLGTCKIQYAADQIVEVPRALMSFAYSDGSGFGVPVVWSRVVKTCEIEITFTKPVESRVVLKYDTDAISKPTTDFWMSGIIYLKSEQVLTIKGNSETVLVEFCDSLPLLYECLKHGPVDLTISKERSALRRWGTQSYAGSIQFSPLNGSRSFFLKSATALRVQIYSKSATPLEITLTSQRKVILVYEMSPSASEAKDVQGLELGEALPAWNGQTVIYRWSDKPVEFLKVASSITHVRIGGYLNPKKLAQLACLFGVSVETIQETVQSLVAGQELAVAHFIK